MDSLERNVVGLRTWVKHSPSDQKKTVFRFRWKLARSIIRMEKCGKGGILGHSSFFVVHASIFIVHKRFNRFVLKFYLEFFHPNKGIFHRNIDLQVIHSNSWEHGNLKGNKI